MVKLTEVPPSDPGRDIAEEIAAETIQNTFRRHKECKPAIKLRRINSEEKLVQDIAADVIKGGIKRSNSIKKNKIPGTPPIGRPSPRTTVMEAQEATGKVAWLEVTKVVLQRLEYKRWDDGVDPYVELNGLVKTGVVWNGAGQPLVWTRTDSVVPVTPGEKELNVRVYDANRVRDDILIGECTIDTSAVPDTGSGSTVLTGSVACPKYRDAKIEVHVRRSSGSNFPVVNEPSIRADHRKLSVDDLDITSDVKKPRDLREEAKRLAKEAEQRRSAPAPPAKPTTTTAPARTERKAEPAFVPAPPRKESQPRREAKAAEAVVRPTEVAPKHELPEELQAMNTKHRRKSKTRAMSPGWLEKNVEAEKKLVIDDAYNESYKKIVNDEGVHLDFGEIAIILNALGYEEAAKPPPGYQKSTRDDASETDEAPRMDGQNFLDRGIVHIPLSETGSAREIAELFTELVHKIDFGIVGTHGNVSPKAEEKEEVPESDHVPSFSMSKREAKIIKDHLVSLVTGMWTRNRNFILLVCGAHPDQGGGRPSNWSISWIQKLANKLDFPEGKFMSCNGIQFLEENRNTVKNVFGIIPSLLQARFALYQHILRLIEAWWTIPSRPSDRVDSSFKATRRQSLPKCATGGYVPFEPQTRKPSKRRPTSGSTKRQGKKEVHRMTLSPTYISKGGSRTLDFDRNVDTLVSGDGVVIGPHLILYPGLLASGRDNGLDVRDHMLEKYAEMVGGRTGSISVFPYGRHSYPGMVWVALKPEEEEEPQQFMQLVKQLEKVDVTDILVSGKHVLVPEVCIMRSFDNQNEIFSEPEERHEVKPPTFQTIGLDRRTSTYAPKHLADTGESNWRDDYSDDGHPAYGGDEDYPPSPEFYIGGGTGVQHAVVTAPLPSILPERNPRPASAPLARQHHRNNSSPVPQKSLLSFVDPSLRESTGGRSGWDTIWSNGERGGNNGSPNATLGRPRSIDDYPTPEKYINGGKGVKKAVVIAPLENPVPNRMNHEKLPDSPPRDRSADRPLYRPLPDLFSTIVPGDEVRPKSQPSRPKCSRGFHTETPATAGGHFEDAVEVLKILSQGLPDINKNSDMKNAVRSSVDRYNNMDNQLKGSMKKRTPKDSSKPKRRSSFDPLKEPVSSRPKPEAKRKKKKKRWDEDFPAIQDEELRKLIERIENISDLEELQDIQDSLAGEFRKRSAQEYGSLVRDHKGVYPDGIIESMIKYKLNHDGDSNSANLKLKKWGVSPSKPDNPDKSKKSESDAENAEDKGEADEIKAPHPLKKEKFIFPWMIGEPRVSDDIDPRKNERLWRALKVAERESSKKEAHLRKQLKRLGVSDENMVVKDPYDTYTNV